MGIIEIAGLRFGEGRPKICVPLTCENVPALLSEVRGARELPADLFEWRIDSFFGSKTDALAMLKQELSAPLLCTLRTEREGGRAAISAEEYEATVRDLLEIGGFELIDIELSCGEERVKRLVRMAKDRQIGVVISLHDFAKTPSEVEIFDLLCLMKSLGADLPKVAVMPRSPVDVLILLAATLRASEKIGPVVTMAMGDLGKISRVSGEIFGSCMTFGAGKTASAPGQIDAEDLRAILDDVRPIE